MGTEEQNKALSYTNSTPPDNTSLPVFFLSSFLMTQIPQNILWSLHKKLGKSTLPEPPTLSKGGREKKS